MESKEFDWKIGMRVFLGPVFASLCVGGTADS